MDSPLLIAVFPLLSLVALYCAYQAGVHRGRRRMSNWMVDVVCPRCPNLHTCRDSDRGTMYDGEKDPEAKAT